MAGLGPRRRARARGRIEELPSGSLRVSVYAGIDPVSKRRHYLREVVPAGPKAMAEAEKVARRLVGQVDERRHPRTTATRAGGVVDSAGYGLAWRDWNRSSQLAQRSTYALR